MVTRLLHVHMQSDTCSVAAAGMCALRAQAPECWAVAFGNSCTDEDRCLLAGYSDGQIRLYDLRTNTLRWQASLFQVDLWL